MQPGRGCLRGVPEIVGDLLGALARSSRVRRALVDAADALDATPAPATGQFDSVAPKPRSPPAGPYVNGPITIAFTSSDLVLPVRLGGRHGAAVRGVHRPGTARSFGWDRCSAFQVHARWMPPATSIPLPPRTPSWWIRWRRIRSSCRRRPHSPRRTWRRSPSTRMRCIRTNVASTAGRSSRAPPRFFAYAGLASGSHVHRVRTAGNVVDAGELSMDRGPRRALALISSGPVPVSGVSDATFAFGSGEPDVTYQCRLDAAAARMHQPDLLWRSSR